MRKLNLISAAYILAWITLPFFEVGTLYRVIGVFAVLTWFLTVNRIKPSFYKESVNVIIIGGLYVLTSFIGNMFISGIGSAIADAVNPFIILVVFLFYYCYRGTKYLHKLATLCVYMFIAVGMMTLYQLWSNPRAARDAYLLYINGDATGLTTIGTYGFIMTSAIIAPIALNVVLSKSISTTERFLYLVFSVVLTLMVLKASYTTAVVLLVISFVLFLVYCNYSSYKGMLIFFIVAFALLFGKTIFIAILEYLMSVTQNNVDYNIRVQEIYHLVTSGVQGTGDIADRIRRYTNTLNELWRNPIFGAAMLRGEYLGGGHSEYLDALAKMGLLYFLCTFWFTFKGPFNVLSSYRIKSIYLPFAVSILVLCIFDTYPYIATLASAVVLPNMSDLLCKGNHL